MCGATSLRGLSDFDTAVGAARGVGLAGEGTGEGAATERLHQRRKAGVGAGFGASLLRPGRGKDSQRRFCGGPLCASPRIAPAEAQTRTLAFVL